MIIISSWSEDLKYILAMSRFQGLLRLSEQSNLIYLERVSLEGHFSSARMLPRKFVNSRNFTVLSFHFVQVSTNSCIQADWMQTSYITDWTLARTISRIQNCSTVRGSSDYLQRKDPSWDVPMIVLYLKLPLEVI